MIQEGRRRYPFSLRFGKSPIRSTYYINNADFISCSLDAYMFKYDMVRNLKDGGTFLLNTTFSKEEIVHHMPNRMKAQLAKKHAKLYIINATKIAQEIAWDAVRIRSCSPRSSR